MSVLSTFDGNRWAFSPWAFATIPPRLSSKEAQAMPKGHRFPNWSGWDRKGGVCGPLLSVQGPSISGRGGEGFLGYQSVGIPDGIDLQPTGITIRGGYEKGCGVLLHIVQRHADGLVGPVKSLKDPIGVVVVGEIVRALLLHHQQEPAARCLEEPQGRLRHLGNGGCPGA